MYARSQTFAEELAGAARMMAARLLYVQSEDAAIFEDLRGRRVKIPVARLRAIHQAVLRAGAPPTLAPLVTVQKAVREAMDIALGYTPQEPGRDRPEERPDRLLPARSHTTLEWDRVRSAERPWRRVMFRVLWPNTGQAVEFEGSVRGPFVKGTQWDCVVNGRLVTVISEVVARACHDFHVPDPEWGAVIAATLFLRGRQ